MCNKLIQTAHWSFYKACILLGRVVSKIETPEVRKKMEKFLDETEEQVRAVRPF